jgi:hypothetical protein
LYRAGRLELRLYHNRSAYPRLEVIAPNPATARGWTGTVLRDEAAFTPAAVEGQLQEAVGPIALRSISDQSRWCSNCYCMNLRLSLMALVLGSALARADDLEQAFVHPPDSARPMVYWMWMGCNLTQSGITGDLEALKNAGFGDSVMVSLADVCTPWAGRIDRSLTPEVITFSEPWWRMVRHAAAESHRLGLEFGFHNCAGYETSGGPWIPPELSMQEVAWSESHRAGVRQDEPGRCRVSSGPPDCRYQAAPGRPHWPWTGLHLVRQLRGGRADLDPEDAAGIQAAARL